MNALYHPVTEKIVTALSERGMWHETFEHEPVRTSEEAAAIRSGYTLRQGAKAMIVRVKGPANEKFFVMLVFPADKKFSFDAVKKIFQAKDIRFATEEEVLEITGGVQPGGVPPFGNLFDLPVIADPSLFENERIVFNAGDRCFSVAMRSEDYKTIVEPHIEPICT